MDLQISNLAGPLRHKSMVHYVLYDAHPVARCVPDSGNCLGATTEPAKCQEIPILVRNQRKAPQTVVCRLPSNLAEQTFRQTWVTDEKSSILAK